MIDYASLTNTMGVDKTVEPDTYWYPTYGLYFMLVFIFLYHAFGVQHFIMHFFGQLGGFITMVIAILQLVYGIRIIYLIMRYKSLQGMWK